MISNNKFVRVIFPLVTALLFLANQYCQAFEEPTVVEVENKTDFIQYKFNWLPDPIVKKKAYWGMVEINSFNGEILSTSSKIKILNHVEWLSIKKQKNDSVTLKSTFLKNDFKAKKALFKRKVLWDGGNIDFNTSEYDFSYKNKLLIMNPLRLEIASLLKVTFNKELKKNSNGSYIVLNGERQVDGKKVSSKIVWFLIEI